MPANANQIKSASISSGFGAAHFNAPSILHANITLTLAAEIAAPYAPTAALIACILGNNIAAHAAYIAAHSA